MGSAAPAASATSAAATSAAAAARIFRGWTRCAPIAVLRIFSRLSCGAPCSSAAALAFFDLSLSSSDCRFRCCCCNARAADPLRRRGRRLEATIAGAIRSGCPHVARWHRRHRSSRRRRSSESYSCENSAPITDRVSPSSMLCDDAARAPMAGWGRAASKARCLRRSRKRESSGRCTAAKRDGRIVLPSDPLIRIVMPVKRRPAEGPARAAGASHGSAYRSVIAGSFGTVRSAVATSSQHGARACTPPTPTHLRAPRPPRARCHLPRLPPCRRPAAHAKKAVIHGPRRSRNHSKIARVTQNESVTPPSRLRVTSIPQILPVHTAALPVRER